MDVLFLKGEVPPEGGWCYGMFVLIGIDTMGSARFIIAGLPLFTRRKGKVAFIDAAFLMGGV